MLRRPAACSPASALKKSLDKQEQPDCVTRQQSGTSGRGESADLKDTEITHVCGRRCANVRKRYWYTK